MTSHHDDMKHELRRTKSVSASLDTFLNTVRNRLRAGVEADSGRGDMMALRELLADLDDRDGIRSSIVHGTVASDQARDVDPDAPPPASNPGSTGGNVYGSKGPEDTDTQRNTSLGAAGADMREVPDGGHAAGIADPADGHTNDPSHPHAIGDQSVSGDRDDRNEYEKWKAERDAKRREPEHA